MKYLLLIKINKDAIATLYHDNSGTPLPSFESPYSSSTFLFSNTSIKKEMIKGRKKIKETKSEVRKKKEKYKIMEVSKSASSELMIITMQFDSFSTQSRKSTSNKHTQLWFS
jgi:predicted RND superfamily exporter protein